MRNSNSLKLEFLRRWIKGLGKCNSLKNMNLLERKKAIKLSADLAMASTRNEDTFWSRALIVNASRNDTSKVLTEHIVGPLECQRLRKVFTSSTTSLRCNRSRINRSSRRILKRCRKIRRAKKMVAPTELGVQKRTKTLKSLLPGGELLNDDVSLIEETLDYIQSLRAQVEVMRCLATNSELVKLS